MCICWPSGLLLPDLVSALNDAFPSRTTQSRWPQFENLHLPACPLKESTPSSLRTPGAQMKTTHKIAAARAIYRVVRTGRTLIGRGDHDVVVRDGISYDVDLSQGIDFAIYLGAYERSTRAALRKLVSPGSLVLDIGANIGAHTLFLAKLVGQEGR